MWNTPANLRSSSARNHEISFSNSSCVDTAEMILPEHHVSMCAGRRGPHVTHPNLDVRDALLECSVLPWTDGDAGDAVMLEQVHSQPGQRVTTTVEDGNWENGAGAIGVAVHCKHSRATIKHRASPSHPQAGVFKRQRCSFHISHEAEGRVRAETDSIAADAVGPAVETDESAEQAGLGGEGGGGGLPGREGDRGRDEVGDGCGGHRQAGDGGNEQGKVEESKKKTKSKKKLLKKSYNF